MSDADRPLCIEELLVPSAFPHDVTELRVVETHISWIVLTGTRAYKIKRPLQLEFIDTSTLERRRHYCEEEVRLNCRLAPELYLGVVPITRVSGRARVAGAGAAIEYAVCLKQFPADAELPVLLQREQVSLAEMIQLGETLAHFHLQTPELTGEYASDATQHMYDTVLANLEQLLEYTEQRWMTPELRWLWEWTRKAIDAHEATFEERVRDHRIRDCHGDLHAANIVRFEGRLVPFDCIDFDPQLRTVDVINDIAFLIMDLHGHRRDDLAAALLSRYLEITGDYAGVRLLPFYAVYRALVRAKVDVIAAEQSTHLAESYIERMRRRVRTALELTQRPRPVLLLMHGVSGAGKSWLSEQLIAPLHAIRITSDVERKRLLRAPPTTAGFKQGNYAPETSHRVYARLMDCAESCLQAGFNVIVDATFLEASDRELFISSADRMAVTCMFISCSADPSTLLDRIAARVAHGGDPSEADQSVVRSQLRDLAPLDTHYRVINVDTRDADAVEKVANAVRSQSS
ncbi:bifunctional aminoglycoside phosphotransferase/ATP-binding protein [Peristeroidobacter agariperforans]|uniref:bifunctional aminoglycoside phosphotransferase/ATP-binding protein n=1 Tax=Peristeroidobacter agariperforans TaxID=268404 RepID=UPI00101D2ED6|nr:bifunctional aminoglycoside phosphotransferase/ATP-binding protein [Peristeroidobacter agariperforans]